MCLLSKYLLELELTHHDALVIQTNNPDEMGFINYSAADAMICRVDTDSGESWIYQPLMFVNEQTMAMPGVHGTLTDVTTAAHYQFGGKLNQAELLGVSYKNPSFPRHLFSHLN
jgi:hypothetical protein